MKQHNYAPALLANCLIYARAFVEYICGGVLFQDVIMLPSVKMWNSRKIRCSLFLFSVKMLK